jgi:predicted  nucleic acid-binding Zn-ribbon protein
MTPEQRETLEDLASSKDEWADSLVRPRDRDYADRHRRDSDAIRAALAENDALTAEVADLQPKLAAVARVIMQMPCENRSYFGGPTLVQVAESARDFSRRMVAEVTDLREKALLAPTWDWCQGLQEQVADLRQQLAAVQAALQRERDALESLRGLWDDERAKVKAIPEALDAAAKEA